MAKWSQVQQSHQYDDPHAPPPPPPPPSTPRVEGGQPTRMTERNERKKAQREKEGGGGGGLEVKFCLLVTLCSQPLSHVDGKGGDNKPAEVEDACVPVLALVHLRSLALRRLHHCLLVGCFMPSQLVTEHLRNGCAFTLRQKVAEQA